MALDRFLSWKKGGAPTREDLEPLLTNFLGGGGDVKWSGDRFYCTLHGTMSPALRTFPGISEQQRRALEELYNERRPRWIEVWLSEDCVDVMTRQQDSFTDGVANSLKDVIRRAFKGDEVDT